LSRKETLLGGLIEGLDLIVYEHTDEGLRRISPLPDWYFWCFRDDIEAVVERSDFLNYFLGEAKEHWAGELASAVLRSGVWEESGGHYEALAVRVEGADLFGIQLSGKPFEELSDQVQRSNELALERSKLNRETQRRVILLDCVVHDLSNPLAAVLVNLQFLVKRLPEGAELQAARTALEQVERQRSMLRSVVGLFSADSGFGDSGDSTADAREAIETAVRAQLDRAMDCRVALTADVGDEPLRVVAEEVHLVRAIENLVVNAIRHSPANCKVRVYAKAVDDKIVVTIEDEGEGIAPEMVAGLFDPFETTAGGGQAGLGLYFCKRALARWGGDIFYQPNEPMGARFSMRLLRAPE